MYPARSIARISAGSLAADEARAEREAIGRVLAGERGAFRLIVERHQRGVHGVIQRLVHNSADAEELAQQTFLRAFEKLGEFRPELRFSAWVYRIAVNLAKDHRKSPRRSEIPSGERAGEARTALFAGEVGAPDAPTAARERRALLERALASLSLRDREILVLKDVEELPFEEIRQILGRPVTALKIRAVRARARLRDTLARLAEKGAL
jgi:RNA polymerase sigma-70 factor (ECF subfamily)